MSIFNHHEKIGPKMDINNCEQVNLNTGTGTMNVYNFSKVKRNIADVSSHLRTWYSCVYGEEHIDREETDRLYMWIRNSRGEEKPKDRVMLLVGEAGSGKSVVMRDLLIRLEKEKIPVLGIKSDVVFSNKGDLDVMIGLEKPATEIIKEYAEKGLVVVLIDQIDALSSVLTSDRGSLRSVNSFVEEISKYRNVRVVVSCRPYDQQYDPSLERYGYGSRIQMDGLPLGKVDEILRIAEIQIEDNEQDVKEFLRNPLNLYLFCKVKNGRLFYKEHPNRTLLYEALWRQVVIDGVQQSEHTHEGKLTESLDWMTTEMYEHQTLAISYPKVESLYPYELSYLSSSNFVYGNQNDGTVQFIHQSLYDYIYARIFLRQGKTVDDILSGIHQGLFIRLRLKQILFYLRDVDREAYFQNLRTLLFARNADGSAKYRFHLKHLMLTNIGFQKSFVPGEEEFIKNHILTDKDYAAVYLDSVNTIIGLRIYTEQVNNKGGIGVLSETEQIQYLSSCERVMYDDIAFAIECLRSIDVRTLKTNALHRYGLIVDRMPITENSAALILPLLDKLEAWSGKMMLDLVLVNLIPYQPKYVRDWLVGNVKNKADEKHESFGVYDINFGHDTEHVYDRLKAGCAKEASAAALDIVKYLCEKTAYETQENEKIKTTHMYLCYQRNQTCSHFVENILTDLLKYYDDVAKDRTPEVVDTLEQLAHANMDGLVLIPTSAYKANISLYKDEAFELSKRIIQDEPMSSVLKYHARELFKVLFPLLTKAQKDEIMDILSNYNPEWEKKTGRLYKDDPVTHIGFAKAQYYALLSSKDIAQYPDAKKHLEEQRRARRGIENHEPFHLEMKTGWTAMGDDAY